MLMLLFVNKRISAVYPPPHRGLARQFCHNRQGNCQFIALIFD
jgi:hypothetical protein